MTWTNSREWWRTYNAYLNSPEWRQKANQVKRRAGWTCECTRSNCHGFGRCGSRGILQANHLTYDRVFHEHLDDLEALCVPCHDRYTAQTRARRKRTGWWRRVLTG